MTVKPSKVSIEVGQKETVQATVTGVDLRPDIFVHSNLTMRRWFDILKEV